MKTKVKYVCQVCGAETSKWMGKCVLCGAWNSFVQEKVPEKASSSQKRDLNINEPVPISLISKEEEFRIKTGITELDRVLGGGIIPGSVILIGGDPGIGKSTLMLQMCNFVGQYNPIYVSGEESLQQIKFRAERLNNKNENLLVYSETCLENIIQTIEQNETKIVIIDSIQSVYSDKIDATPGSIVQVRESASALMQIAKTTGKAIFLVGHLTKDGMIAGPKLLEHLVDTVLQFEGEKTYSYRILRCLKNRFGSTNEIGIFQMEEQGLVEVENPSEFFLAQRLTEDSGIAIIASIEGSRPILLEVQALVTPTSFAVPQRVSNGIDIKRLNMILAVLEKRIGEKFRTNDVFVNVAGGVYISDPSADLGLAFALISSLRDRPIDKNTLFIGEIGLSGEVRPVSFLEQRIKEAQKLGFSKICLPASSFKKIESKYKELELIPIERVSVGIATFFNK